MKILTSGPNRTQLSLLSTSTKNNVYSSNVNFGKNKNQSQKSNGVAINYFNDGTRQCNKIRSKYKKVPSNTKWSWTPQPFTPTAEIGQSFMKRERSSTPKPKAINLRKYEPKDENDFFDNNELLPKIILRRSHYQNIPEKKKFKIVYPANTVKHKMGLYPITKNKRYKSFAQEKERNPGIPVTHQQSKKKVPPPKFLPPIHFTPPSFINKADPTVTYESSETFQRALKQGESSRLITVHPILKKANYQ